MMKNRKKYIKIVLIFLPTIFLNLNISKSLAQELNNPSLDHNNLQNNISIYKEIKAETSENIDERSESEVNDFLIEIESENNNSQPINIPLQNLFIIPSVLPTIKQPPVNGYVDPPQFKTEEEVNPNLTSFILNNFNLNHLTDWEFLSTYTFGDNRSNNFDGVAIFRVDDMVEQSLSESNIFRQHQTSEYISLGSLRSNREVSFRQSDPVTASGMRLQQSFTGNCDAFGILAPVDTNCTYTPAIITDIEGSDPLSSLPSRIFQVGNVGELVSPTSRAILAQPGFQNEVENGQIVGIDFFFPNNLGATAGNTQSDETTITRNENFDSFIVPGFYRINQILTSSSEEIFLSRTIRGFNFIADEENIGFNSLIQAATELIPDAEFIPQSTNLPPSKDINPNLFKASNLARVPNDSLTVYLGGLANSSIPTELNRSPNANFHGLWIGLSPVTTYNLEQETFGVATGDLIPIAAGGGEGGVDDPVNFTSQVNEFILSTEELSDFYVQVYLTFFERDVNRILTSKLTEETNYFPHISFTGNITNQNHLFRYYTGVIPYSDTGAKAYLGTDYAFTSNGWTLYGDIIGYLNPTRDYYSQAGVGVNKNFDFSSDTSIDFFSNLNYALDRDNNVGRFVLEDLINTVNVGSKLNLDFATLSVQYNLDDILPDSVQSALTISSNVVLSNNLQIGGFYTLESDRSNTPLYGANMQIRLNEGKVKSFFNINWSREQYDFGDDPFDRPLRTDEDEFSLIFRMEGI